MVRSIIAVRMRKPGEVKCIVSHEIDITVLKNGLVIFVYLTVALAFPQHGVGHL